jgi:hypothetical protein
MAEQIDEYRALVHACVETYREIPDSKSALDINGVSGKLRVQILNDPEYVKETRSIHAKLQMAELKELDAILSATSMLMSDNDGFDVFNRDMNKTKRNAKTDVDKDVLDMRLKVAQAKRKVLDDLSKNGDDSEKDNINFCFIGMTRKEIEDGILNEVHEGNDDDGLDDLLNVKEALPESATGKTASTPAGTRLERDKLLRLKGDDDSEEMPDCSYTIDPDTREVVEE